MPRDPPPAEPGEAQHHPDAVREHHVRLGVPDEDVGVVVRAGFLEDHLEDPRPGERDGRCDEESPGEPEPRPAVAGEKDSGERYDREPVGVGKEDVRLLAGERKIERVEIAEPKPPRRHVDEESERGERDQEHLWATAEGLPGEKETRDERTRVDRFVVRAGPQPQGWQELVRCAARGLDDKSPRPRGGIASRGPDWGGNLRRGTCAVQARRDRRTRPLGPPVRGEGPEGRGSRSRP